VSKTPTEPAPIALFVYKRPEHARRAVASLRACEGFEESPMYVFADGPKSGAEASAVMETRAAMRELLGTRSTYVEQERNLGLANSIIAGTTQLCERHGRAIVVEDDLVMGPSFLRFLNEGLERYRDEPRVMHVTGHMFDVPSLADHHEALLLPMISSLGWATWKRAWDQFDPDATGWEERLHGDVLRRFNLDGNYDYARMLRRQMSHGIDSWAIRWYYTLFVRGGLSLFPPSTLVRHTGDDGSGTHGRIRRVAEQVIVAGNETWPMPEVVAASPFTADVFNAIGKKASPSVWRTITRLIPSKVRSAGRPAQDREGKGTHES
jgi:hypothetical protein